MWLCGRHRNNRIKCDLFNKKRFLKLEVVYEMFAKETISEHVIDKCDTMTWKKSSFSPRLKGRPGDRICITLVLREPKVIK